MEQVLELACVFEGQPSSEPPERPSEAGSRKKGPKKGQVVLDLQPKPGATSLDKRFLFKDYIRCISFRFFCFRVCFGGVNCSMFLRF